MFETVKEAVKCLGTSVFVRNRPATCRLMGGLSITADALGHRKVMLSDGGDSIARWNHHCESAAAKNQ